MTKLHKLAACWIRFRFHRPLHPPSFLPHDIYIPTLRCHHHRQVPSCRLRTRPNERPQTSPSSSNKTAGSAPSSPRVPRRTPMACQFCRGESCSCGPYCYPTHRHSPRSQAQVRWDAAKLQKLQPTRARMLVCSRVSDLPLCCRNVTYQRPQCRATQIGFRRLSAFLWNVQT